MRYLVTERKTGATRSIGVKSEVYGVRSAGAAFVDVRCLPALIEALQRHLDGLDG